MAGVHHQCEQTLVSTLKEHLIWAQTETKTRFDTDQKTAVHQLKDNNHTNKEALKLVKKSRKSTPTKNSTLRNSTKEEDRKKNRKKEEY